MNQPDHHVIADIVQFLSQVQPDLPDPSLGFLGGSRAINNGKFATKTSDYDVIIFFPTLEIPASYSFKSKDGERHYDLILRDMESFFYDLDQEIQVTGRGTLLHLISYGRPLFGEDSYTSLFQKLMMSLHKNGPYLIHPQDIQDKQDILKSDIHGFTSHHQHHDVCLAFSLALLNRTASDLLRFSHHWAAPGKIASRFLDAAFPSIKEKLLHAFQMGSRYQRFEGFQSLMTNQADNLYIQAQKSQKPVSQPRKKTESFFAQDDYATAITNSRLFPDGFSFYLQRDEQLPCTEAASTWAHIKIGVVSSAISSERYKSRPTEYLFSLSRGVSTFADINTALSSRFPSRVPLEDKIKSSLDKYPTLGSSVQQALSGQPETFLELFLGMKKFLPCTPDENLYRPSPSHFRKSSSLFVNRDLLPR